MKKYFVLGSMLLLLSACGSPANGSQQASSSPAKASPVAVQNAAMGKENSLSPNNVPEQNEVLQTPVAPVLPMSPVSAKVVAPVGQAPVAKVKAVSDDTYPGYALKVDTQKYDANVNRIQARLNLIGYHLKVDGYFGPSTLEAVKYVQEQNQLAQDGIVGPKTWDVLFHNTIAAEDQSAVEGDE